MNRTFLRALCLLCALLMMGSLALTGCGETAEKAEEATEETTKPEETPVVTEPNATKPGATEPKPGEKTHDHDEPSAMSLSYKDNDDGSVSIVIKDCKGKQLINEKVPSRQHIKEDLAKGILCLSWVTDKNSPEGYESLYINRLTCQVSGIIKGIQAHNNERIVYTEVKDNKLKVIARDLFYAGGYYKEIPVENAYLDGDSTVKGAVKVMDGKKVKAINLIYFTSKDGKEGVVRVDLTEKDKTESAKTTKKTDKK